MVKFCPKSYEEKNVCGGNSKKPRCIMALILYCYCLEFAAVLEKTSATLANISKEEMEKLITVLRERNILLATEAADITKISELSKKVAKLTELMNRKSSSKLQVFVDVVKRKDYMKARQG